MNARQRSLRSTDQRLPLTGVYVKFIVATSFANTLAATAFSVDQNMITLIGVLLTTIALVVAVINWIDKRIEHKIKGNAQLFKLQHDMLLQEIRHLKVFLGYKEPPHERTTLPVPSERPSNGD